MQPIRLQYVTEIFIENEFCKRLAFENELLQVCLIFF